MQVLFQYPDMQGTEIDMLDAGPIGEVAQAAERYGWGGLSVTEHPAPSARWLAAGGHQTLDPFVLLGHAAAVTERLRLVTFLAVAPYRNPMLLAKSAATVDVLSGGRFVLGLGTGYLKSEFFALGVDFGERNELFDEALDVLPLHWSGEPFSYKGRHFEAREVIARPKPPQQPIPIWIGGNSQVALRRAAERAQGWMPMLAAPQVATTARTPHIDSIESLAAKIVELNELAGERTGRLDVAVAYHGADAPWPTTEPERHREAFGRLEEIGATWLVVSCPGASREATLEFVQGFGDTYLH